MYAHHCFMGLQKPHLQELVLTVLDTELHGAEVGRM